VALEVADGHAAAMASARSVSAMTHAAGRSYRSARAVCGRGSDRAAAVDWKMGI
jgi:hypothetical protein